MDPNAGGKVQPLNAGRIEPGPRGLPNAGQAVRKGEVLAYVVPVGGAHRALQPGGTAGRAACRQGLADKRVARLQELADTVPRKEIEAAESEAASLTARIAAVGGGLSTREALLAPVSGVIASANVVAGQVVDARELIFEIVDPSRLRIEALAFDAAIAQHRHRDDGRGQPSVCRSLSSAPRAACVNKRCPWPSVPRANALNMLAVGQPVRVFVQTKDKVKGISGARGLADEEPGQPDRRLGQDGARALRTPDRHHRAAGRCQRRQSPRGSNPVTVLRHKAPP
jgi:cobalt-zinc-cadmium efflux system membrane fusion protein